MHSLAALTILTLLTAIPPLDDSQTARLEAAADGTGTVDEAAFYALLENAREWPESAAAGAMVPDYTAIRDDPEAHRGQLFLLEGRVQYMLPETRWSRSGWEQVRGLVIRIDDRPDGEHAAVEDLVIVHLIDPPTLTASLHGDVPIEFNQPVRVVARFHKTVNYPRRRGEGDAAYLNFVGQEVAWMGEREGSGPGAGFAFLLLALALIGLVFLIFRVRNFNRVSLERHRTAEYLAEKRARRQQEAQGHADGEADHEEVEPPLPEDPIEALEALKRQHREEDEH